ncbi:MAG: prepilin-type N-terminal cleavage/methylation domain-containing protein [Clostridia bacterium]
MKKNFKSGFTLVELLVCLVIIIILVAILLPMYSQYITKAKQSQALADGRSAALATQSVFHQYYGSGELFLLAKDDRENNDWGIEENENAGYQMGDWVGLTKAAYDEIIALSRLTGVITGVEYSTDGRDTLLRITYCDPDSGFKATYLNGKWTTE